MPVALLELPVSAMASNWPAVGPEEAMMVEDDGDQLMLVDAALTVMGTHSDAELYCNA